MKTRKLTCIGTILLAIAMLCAVGCTKPNDDNNGNNNGGGETIDYETYLSDTTYWIGTAPGNTDIVIGMYFVTDTKEIYFAEVDDYKYYGISAHGTYAISGNVITATYILVEVYGEPFDNIPDYGFVDGEVKKVTYTIQSLTETTLVVKESVLGDTFTLTKTEPK